MSKLMYLLDEVCAGLEIYYSGRTGGQYYKSAFVLCDDYVELTSKLYLVENDSTWGDKKSGRFKNFPTVVDEAHNLYVGVNGPSPDLQALGERTKDRRKRRNDFFHGTNLLDLNVTHRMCVDAFKDLLDYGALLFGATWVDEARGARNLETLELLIRLESRCFSEPSLTSSVSDLIASWPRNKRSSAGKGVQIAVHPEDLHLRLCVINGAVELRDRLAALLAC